jgi:hypothetical protein
MCPDARRLVVSDARLTHSMRKQQAVAASRSCTDIHGAFVLSIYRAMYHTTLEAALLA